MYSKSLKTLEEGGSPLGRPAFNCTWSPGCHCMSPDPVWERAKDCSRTWEMTCLVYWLTRASSEGLGKGETGMLSWRVEKQQFPKRPPEGGEMKQRGDHRSSVELRVGGINQDAGGELQVVWGRKVSPHIAAGRLLMHYWFLPAKRFPPILSPVQSTQACRLARTPGSGLVFQVEVRIWVGFIFHGALNLPATTRSPVIYDLLSAASR